MNLAHFACLCIPAWGHFNPMAVLARELVRRGHTATFVQMPEVEARVRARGLDFVAIGAATHGPGTLARMTRMAGAVRGPVGVLPVVREAARETAMLCAEAPDVVRSLGVDMILSDQLQPAGGLIARHLDLPYVSIACALPINWEQGVPPPTFGWTYGETRWHRYRNILGQHALRPAMKPLEDMIESIAREWRLAPLRRIGHCASHYAQIAQLVPSLDFPRRSLAACFHYCGPLRDEGVPRAAAEPRSRTGSAFASLGSMQGHRAALFEKIAAATTRCGLDVTIAHGGGLSPSDAARLSRHATVRDFVAHDEVLRQADVAILHGGLNTVLDALAHGVPMVLVPLAYEQGAIASRVARSGAGRVCPRHVPRSLALSSLVREVLDNPAYAEAAGRLRDEIHASGGVRRAADIVEQVARTGAPVFNPALLQAPPAARGHRRSTPRHLRV